jgi:hypothetical protein
MCGSAQRQSLRSFPLTADKSLLASASVDADELSPSPDVCLSDLARSRDHDLDQSIFAKIGDAYSGPRREVLRRKPSLPGYIHLGFSVEIRQEDGCRQQGGFVGRGPPYFLVNVGVYLFRLPFKSHRHIVGDRAADEYKSIVRNDAMHDGRLNVPLSHLDFPWLVGVRTVGVGEVGQNGDFGGI